MQAKKRVVEYFQNGRELVGPGEFQRGDKMQPESDVDVQPCSSQVKRLASELEEDTRDEIDSSMAWLVEALSGGVSQNVSDKSYIVCVKSKSFALGSPSNPWDP